MMRDTEKELEKKRKKKGGSNGENLREWEKKRNCPFDAKKVCPITNPSISVHFESGKCQRLPQSIPPESENPFL